MREDGEEAADETSQVSSYNETMYDGDHVLWKPYIMAGKTFYHGKDRRSQMKKIWETAVILFAAMSFWGMLYPDLCFTGDVCVVMEMETDEDDVTPTDANNQKQKAVWGDSRQTASNSDIYQAEPGQIRIRSRLLELWNQRIVGITAEARELQDSDSQRAVQHEGRKK